MATNGTVLGQQLGARLSRRRFTGTLLAALALPLAAKPEFALAGGGTGSYGSHYHGTATGYTPNYIVAHGAWVKSNRSSWGASDPGNQVAMQAFLYRWNGSSWAYLSGSGWKWITTVRGTGLFQFAPVRFPVSGYLSNGYYRVANVFHWYDRATGRFMGTATNSWTAHYNYSGANAGPASYLTLFGSARDGEAKGAAPKGRDNEPRLAADERKAPKVPTGERRRDDAATAADERALADLPQGKGEAHEGNEPAAPGKGGEDRDGGRRKR